VITDQKQSDRQAQRTLALWAADCAEHVLGLFEAQRPHDDRPRKAIETACAWARGEINCTPARAAAVAAHAAARAATDPAAIATARLCGHTAAIAHSARHAGGVPLYACKAVTAAAGPAAAAKGIAWQKRRLPKKLWPLAFPAAIKPNAATPHPNLTRSVRTTLQSRRHSRPLAPREAHVQRPASLLNIVPGKENSDD
jgi:hypothetical protein